MHQFPEVQEVNQDFINSIRKGNFIDIIPNYPNLNLHISQPRIIQNSKIKIVFVGSVGTGRGIEEIIDVLNFKIANHQIELHIKGYLDSNYKEIMVKTVKEKIF